MQDNNFYLKNCDMIRAVVMTRAFRLEGDIHFPRLGKEGRRFSNLLNSDRKFIAMTNVQVIHLANGLREPELSPFMEISIGAIEFVQPCLDGAEAEREANESIQSSIS